jgi:hypothetical protein
MRAFAWLLGPKATPACVVLFLLIAPVAVWHHVHLVIHIWKTWREEKKETHDDKRD